MSWKCDTHDMIGANSPEDMPDSCPYCYIVSLQTKNASLQKVLDKYIAADQYRDLSERTDPLMEGGDGGEVVE